MSKGNATTLDWSWKAKDSYSTFYAVIAALCSVVTLILIVANKIKTTTKVKKFALTVLASALLLHTFYYLMAYHVLGDGRGNQALYRCFVLTGKLQLKLGHINMLLVSLMNTEVLGA
jgi:glucan phosphoethanolaminetransferase (alkaline phosphatase superfamily)